MSTIEPDYTDTTDPLDEPSNEDLSNALRERLGGDESASESEPALEAEQGGEEEQVSPQVTTPPPPEYIDVGDGKQIALEDAIRYQQFEEYLVANPEIVIALQGISSGELELIRKGQQQEAPTPVEIPEGVDLDDPNIRFLYERLQAAESELTSTREQLTSHEAQILTQSRATIDSLFNKAKESFKTERDLSEDEIDRVSQVAGNLNILPGLLSGTDPATGLPVKVDQLEAIGKALEIAYWSMPEYRDKEINRQLTENQTNNDRKRKLSALGGSGGSVTKETKAPTTAHEIRDAMIRDVAAAMSGQEKE